MSSLYKVAVVGASTLKGKELKELLEERGFPALDVKLLDDDELAGQLDAVGDEATFLQSVSREQFEGVDLAFFASNPAFTNRNWMLARDAGSTVVDLSYALEEEPGAEVRAPVVTRELRGELTPAQTSVAAHPAAVILALLLSRAQRAGGLRRSVATILEPVSERGKAGLEELHQQTVSLFSFQQLPTAVFDSQVAFNLLPCYGEKSLPTLESVERRIARHLRKLVGEQLPLPSLMLAQAPIFHGYVLSIYIEMERAMSVGDLSQALAGGPVAVTRLTESSPSNVSVAGQEQVLVAVRRDQQQEEGVWLWAAADNLKLAAATAVDCALVSAPARPGGRIQ